MKLQNKVMTLNVLRCRKLKKNVRYEGSLFPSVSLLSKILVSHPTFVFSTRAYTLLALLVGL